MKFSKKAIGLPALLFLFLVEPTSYAKSIETTDSTFKKALYLLEKGRTAFDEKLLAQAREVFEPCANRATGRFECHYQLARTCLSLSVCYDLDNHRDEAKKVIETGIQNAQKAVLLQGDSAEAHSILTMLYEARLGHEDFFTGMDTGPKVGEENKKALTLAPDNAQVQLAAGIQYVMAPPIGGGDVKKGITTLQKALELDPKMDEAYYWLAKAYRKQNNRVSFKKALDSALRLNPGNVMAEKEEQSWQ